MSHDTFSCKCTSKKSHELLMDGGILGLYVLKLCPDCYSKQDKTFRVK